MLGRYRNLIVLVAVLFAQVLGLAVQVKRSSDTQPTRLIRVWAVAAVSPFEEGLHWFRSSSGSLWQDYMNLRGVRAQNRVLEQQLQQMRLAQVRLAQDADQAHRLQALLAFKEQFIAQTTAAQVIGWSGSEQSRSVYIDKGAREGIKPDMAVISKDGIVGKVLQVFGSNPLERSVSQVLLINDQTSGVGAILEKSRLQGILRGMPSGDVVLEKVMSDETVPVGEQVLTSGGDGIFPKGLPVGSVTKVSTGSDLFFNIRVRPAADLSRLEEVLVVTKIDEQQAQPEDNAPVRAIDILAQRLPTVPPKPDAAPGGSNAPSATPAPVTKTGDKQNQAKPAPAPGTAAAGAPGTATRNPPPIHSQQNPAPPPDAATPHAALFNGGTTGGTPSAALTPVKNTVLPSAAGGLNSKPAPANHASANQNIPSRAAGKPSQPSVPSNAPSNVPLQPHPVNQYTGNQGAPQ
jgi:rod shape-determining protein MreC